MKRFFEHFDEIPTIEEITATNPSEYYRQKQDEAEAWTKLRDYALVKMMPSPVLRQLERHIEDARYVGD